MDSIADRYRVANSCDDDPPPPAAPDDAASSPMASLAARSADPAASDVLPTAVVAASARVSRSRREDTDPGPVRARLFPR